MGIITFNLFAHFKEDAQYDGRNLPLTAEDALGNTMRYEYDEAGNLVRVTDQDDFVTGFAYDLNSQLTNIRYEDNRQVAFTYDPRGYMTGFTDWLGENSFELDPLGRITHVTDFASELLEQLLPGGFKTKYKYDAISQITELRHIDHSGKVTGSYAYIYDPAGNKTAVSKNAFDEDEL